MAAELIPLRHRIVADVGSRAISRWADRDRPAEAYSGEIRKPAEGNLRDERGSRYGSAKDIRLAVSPHAGDIEVRPSGARTEGHRRQREVAGQGERRLRGPARDAEAPNNCVLRLPMRVIQANRIVERQAIWRYDQRTIGSQGGPKPCRGERGSRTRGDDPRQAAARRRQGYAGGQAGRERPVHLLAVVPEHQHAWIGKVTTAEPEANIDGVSVRGYC